MRRFLGSELVEKKALISFPVEQLIDNSTTDFELFVYLRDHLILYSGAGYRWERSEITQLLAGGFRELFVSQVDINKVSMYRALAQLPIVSEVLPASERVQTIADIGAEFTKCLYEGELSLECVRKASDLASNIVDCVSEDPTCIKHLQSLESHHHYTYYHSVRVAVYATAIALTMGQTQSDQLQSIALGGIFHDIGKKDIAHSILNKSGALAEDEWKLVKKHPEFGFQALDNMIFNHISREIVIHHHEKLNGEGYPHGLDRGSILTEVQIATLADIFDALTSKRAYQTTRTRYEALDFIKHRFLGEELAVDTFKALIQCFAD